MARKRTGVVLTTHGQRTRKNILYGMDIAAVHNATLFNVRIDIQLRSRLYRIFKESRDVTEGLAGFVLSTPWTHAITW